jgi:hypothetical protein
MQAKTHRFEVLPAPIARGGQPRLVVAEDDEIVVVPDVAAGPERLLLDLPATSVFRISWSIDAKYLLTSHFST